MKNFLLVLVTITTFAFTANAQTAKLAVVEEFTNASCPPCAAQNPDFDALMAANKDKAIVLKYQVWFPGFDPMYEQNTVDVRARADFYDGGFGVPNGRVEGVDVGVVSGITQASINAAAAPMSPLDIKLTHNADFDKKTMTISCVIKNVSPDMWMGAGHVAQIAITEEDIMFNEPPGSTDESHFTNVMRKMLPNASGTAMMDIMAGDSMVIEFTDIDVPDYIYNFGEIGVVAFVQNNLTRASVQAAVSAPQPVQGVDAGISSMTTGPSSYCDYNMTPRVEITNNGLVDATEMEIAYSINGGFPVGQMWTGSLASGQTETVEFPAITLMPPSTSITYSILSVNGATDIDYNNINNETSAENFVNLTANPTREDAMEGFDITELGEVPAGVIMTNPDVRIFTVNNTINPNVVTWQLGGHGNSNGCVRYDFYAMNAGETGTVMLDQVSLANVSAATLVFSHAYAQYTTEPDRLEVVVSTDCGVNWSTVWDAAGAALATRPPVNPDRFYPRPTEWVQNVVDLSFLDGASEVTIGFRGTSAFGNSVYLDDIQIGAGLVNADDVNPLAGKVAFFPNPVSDNLTIEVTLEEASPITAEVFDLTGKRVAVINSNTNYPSGTHNLTWNTTDQSNGMYMVRVLTEAGEYTERVSVLK